MSLKFNKSYSKKNNTLINLLKSNEFTYEVVLGSVNYIGGTNIKIIEPTAYVVTKPINITIFEYEITERQNKNFYIKKFNQKYNIKDLRNLLKNLK